MAYPNACLTLMVGSALHGLYLSHSEEVAIEQRLVGLRQSRALRIILGIFSVLAAAGGLLIISSGKPLMPRLFLRPPESEVSTLLLFMMREMGGFVLMLSLMLFFGARDPARNVAIINAVAVGLCILAITPLLSLYTLDIRRLYPSYLIWGRSLVRLVLAAVLFYLRPREAVGAQL